MIKSVTPELIQHIKDRNAKSKAWMDAAPGRWSSMLVEDPKHWADYEIYTIDEFNHYMAQSTHYEIYKDINGISPRWMNYESMTTAEIEAENKEMYKELDDQIKSEKKEKEDVIKKVSQYGTFTEQQLKKWRVI